MCCSCEWKPPPERLVARAHGTRGYLGASPQVTAHRVQMANCTEVAWGLILFGGLFSPAPHSRPRSRLASSQSWLARPHLAELADLSQGVHFMKSRTSFASGLFALLLLSLLITAS